MKLTYFLAALLIFQTTLTSCEKQNDPEEEEAIPETPRPRSIKGLWIGTYTDSRNTPEYISYIIKPDGTILVEGDFYGEQQLAQGLWTLSGDNLNVNLTYFYGTPTSVGTVQTSATIFSNDSTLTGTWQSLPPNAASGVISLRKVY